MCMCIRIYMCDMSHRIYSICMYIDVFTLCPGVFVTTSVTLLPCFSDELATACVPLMLAAMHFCIVFSR